MSDKQRLCSLLGNTIGNYHDPIRYSNCRVGRPDHFGFAKPCGPYRPLLGPKLAERRSICVSGTSRRLRRRSPVWRSRATCRPSWIALNPALLISEIRDAAIRRRPGRRFAYVASDVTTTGTWNPPRVSATMARALRRIHVSGVLNPASRQCS